MSGFQAKEVLWISIETKGSAFELEASKLCPILVQQNRRMPETLIRKDKLFNLA